jgi:hypothetical protein
MPLTDTAIRKTNPTDKPFKLFDERGLFLLVVPSGGKWWRFRYRFDGKNKSLSMGVYPDVPLTKTRDRREKARQLLADGIDPGEQRKTAKEAKVARATNSFEAVAREWFAKYSPRWATSHSDKIIKRLENDVFPRVGGKPISEISPPEVLKVLHRIEGRGAMDTAHRALQNCGQVFRYGVATGRVLSVPCRDLRGALRPLKHEHSAAITSAKFFRHSFRSSSSNSSCNATTSNALSLLSSSLRVSFPLIRANNRSASSLDNAFAFSMYSSVGPFRFLLLRGIANCPFAM